MLRLRTQNSEILPTDVVDELESMKTHKHYNSPIFLKELPREKSTLVKASGVFFFLFEKGGKSFFVSTTNPNTP